ncbi:hypothetical protein OSTOST_25556 [Ostertagia ostertagi]
MINLFCLESITKQVFFWSQEERTADALLPIYTENDFGSVSRVLRENTDPTIQSCASRLRHGNCPSVEGAQLITTVVNWNKSDSGAAQFRICCTESLRTAEQCIRERIHSTDVRCSGRKLDSHCSASLSRSST